jgi:cation diffusion facilitator family transporter
MAYPPQGAYCPAMEPTADLRTRQRAAVLSLVTGLLMLVLKMGAYLLTGSTTILSDALESVVHVAAVLFMFLCFRFASAPPDAEHPYGHGKAEYLSIGFEGGTIALAALAILWEAVRGLVVEHAPSHMDLGIILVVIASLINLALGLYLLRVGRTTRSQILVADGQHVLGDVWTSLGVIAGVVVMLVVPEGRARAWIDGLVAIALAAFILTVGGRLLRQAMRGLLDEVDPAALARVVASINEIRDPAWRDVHNLRLRTSGDFTFVDFHLVVPSLWSVAAAHSAVERLEHHILSSLKAKGAVMIHLDHPHSDPTVGLDRPPSAEEVAPFTVAQASRMKPDERLDDQLVHLARS